MVVLWSKESVKSKWVETEASEGERRGILVPVLIDDVLPPLAFRMIETAKLIDWDGSLSNNEFDLLSKSVARILGLSEPSKIEIHQPYEQENMGRKERGEERKGTKEPHIQIKEEEKTKLWTIKDVIQFFQHTNENSQKQSYRVFWTRMFWLFWLAYTTFAIIFLIYIDREFIPNVVVIYLANIFTFKKYKLAPHIFEVAVLVQIGSMFIYQTAYFEQIVLKLAIASAFYYFSRVSRTLIME